MRKIIVLFLLITSTATAYQGRYYAPNLSGLWHFNEGSGSVAGDASPSHNGGSLQGGVDNNWVSGKMGYALNYDGIDDYVKIPDNDNLTPSTSGFTVCVWAKFDKMATGYPLVSKYIAPYEWYFQTGYYSASVGKLTAIIRDESNNVLEVTTQDVVLQTAKWLFIVMTYDGGGDAYSISFFVNCDDKAMVVNGAGTLVGGGKNAGGSMRIGGGGGINESDLWAAFPGTIDEVAIYSRAITKGEMQEMYRTSRLIYEIE